MPLGAPPAGVAHWKKNLAKDTAGGAYRMTCLTCFGLACHPVTGGVDTTR